MSVAFGRIVGIAFVASILASCSGGTENHSTIGVEVPSSAFSQDNPYTGGNYDTPLPQPVLKFTADAAGPLGSAPIYSAKDVQAKLPGFETTTVKTAQESAVKPAMATLYQGQQAMQLFKGAGGKVAEIHAASGIVAGPAGEQVGMTFRQAGMSRKSCRVGKNYWRGMAICPSRAASNVTLVFALPGYRGPFNRMPPENAIGGAVLQRFVWTPPRS